MLNATLTHEAVEKLQSGSSSLTKEAIARIDGTPVAGELVRFLDPTGRAIGVGDVDLDSDDAIQLLGRPEESPEGLIPRHLRAALERRGAWVDDPRYCRVVHEDGDGLPGLTVDRFDQHYLVRSTTRSMDARINEVGRSLAEVVGGTSVLVRNDSVRRLREGLPLQRPHVVFGSPPRWTRALEMGARFSVDLFGAPNTDFRYEHRELRRAIRTLSQGARVLDPACGIGGLFVHAGLAGAKSVTAFARLPDQLELARENVDANALMGRASVELGDAMEVLHGLHTHYDLILLDLFQLVSIDAPLPAFFRLLQLAIRAVRHGGALAVAADIPPLGQGQLDELLVQACEEEERVCIQLVRPGLPPDFPRLLRSPMADTFASCVVELS